MYIKKTNFPKCNEYKKSFFPFFVSTFPDLFVYIHIVVKNVKNQHLYY